MDDHVTLSSRVSRGWVCALSVTRRNRGGAKDVLACPAEPQRLVSVDDCAAAPLNPPGSRQAIHSLRHPTDSTIALHAKATL